jgi:hypothetical protein
MGYIMSLYFQLSLRYLNLLAQTAHIEAHISSHIFIHNRSSLPIAYHIL